MKKKQNEKYTTPTEVAQLKKELAAVKQERDNLQQQLQQTDTLANRSLEYIDNDAGLLASLEESEEEFSHAKTSWLFGDWSALAEVDIEIVRNHPQKDRFAMLIAGAHQQLGCNDEARRFTRMAKDWGCPKKIIAKVLIAGVHNTLGRAAALKKDDKRIEHHFANSVDVLAASRESELVSYARMVREMTKMGLLYDATRILTQKNETNNSVQPFAFTSSNVRCATQILGISGQLKKEIKDWSVNRRGDFDYVPYSIPKASTSEKYSGHRLLVCTHHKAGTSFLMKIFSTISKEFNWPIWMKFYNPALEPKDWRICFEQHSRISEIINKYDFRGVHVVRHPMSLIFSAALYHMKCNEPWVDVPLQFFSANTFWSATHGPLYNLIKDPKVSLLEKKEIMNSDYSGDLPSHLKFISNRINLNGKTYREHLLSLPSIEGRVLFEMGAYSRYVVSDMLSFPNDERFYNINIESLSFDSSQIFLEDMFKHLGFRGGGLNHCINIAMKNCIFKSGKSTVGGHGTTGLSEKWRGIFKGEVFTKYRELFGFAEQALGFK